MFGLCESYNRRRLRDVRRELQNVAAVVQRKGRRSDPHRSGRGEHPSALADSLRELSTDLSRLEPKVDEPTTDIIFSTMMLRMSFRHLKTGAMQLDRDFRERYPGLSPKRSPFPPLFKHLDKLEDAILRLYGPPTKFQRQLKKLVQKAAVSIYRLAQLAEVDETYLRRLVTGEMRSPGEGVVIALAMALRKGSSSVTVRDIHRLIRSGGYRTPSREELDDYHAAISS